MGCRPARCSQPERFWRLECQPGEEAQVDFGLGAPIEDGRVKARKSWVFRMVLSYSRKAYSGAVSRQDTETFLRCLENGLRSFGGSPLLLNLDNLKAASPSLTTLKCRRCVSGVCHGVPFSEEPRWFLRSNDVEFS